MLDRWDICLKVKTTKREHHITSIMDNENHNASSYFVAHHGKQNETTGNSMMKAPFIEFTFIISSKNKKLEK